MMYHEAVNAAARTGAVDREATAGAGEAQGAGTECTAATSARPSLRC